MAGNKRRSDIEKGRIIAFLTREEMEYLDKLGMDALFSTGHKITRIDIIAALVDAVMRLKVSGLEVKTKEDLVRNIMERATLFSEKRKFPRLKTHLIAGFRKVDSYEKYKGGMTGDISVGGFRVDMQYPDPLFVIGQAMEITIRDPREKGEPISGLGRVAWMREKDDHSGYEVGVMLTYIRAEDKARYMQYFFEKTPA